MEKKAKHEPSPAGGAKLLPRHRFLHDSAIVTGSAGVVSRPTHRQA